MTRAFWVLWKREAGALLLSPIAWVLLTCMALVSDFSFSQCGAQTVRVCSIGALWRMGFLASTRRFRYDSPLRVP